MHQNLQAEKIITTTKLVKKKGSNKQNSASPQII